VHRVDNEITINNTTEMPIKKNGHETLLSVVAFRCTQRAVDLSSHDRFRSAK
jgi:hypothetical protein